MNQLLDLSGTFFSLLSTYFYAKAKVLAWPVGILAAAINFLLYERLGIFADAKLECLYICMGFYGWYQWLYKGEAKNKLAIQHCPPHILFRLGKVSLLLFVMIYFLLSHLTSSTVTLLDALTTALSLSAQWMMCKKYIETWLMWFVVDAIYFILYAIKCLPFHCLLMGVYLVIAVGAYVRWHKQLTSDSPAAQQAC